MQGIEISKKRFGITRRHRLQRLTTLADRANDFVFDVRDVHDMSHLVTAIRQPAPQQIFKDKGPVVADVRIIVDGRPTGIEPDSWRIQRNEFLLRARQRVVEMDGHVVN